MEISKVLCDICDRLALKKLDFENPPFEPEGRYQQIVLTESLQHLRQKASGCYLCYLFWQAIKRNEQNQPHVLQEATMVEIFWMQSNMEYSNINVEDENAWGSALYPRVQHPDNNSNYGVQLVDDADTPMFLRGRVIAPAVDIAMLQGWLECCRHEHGPDCADVGFAAPDHPRSLSSDFLVIDVNDRRLCSLPVDETYVTLSYVWGTAKMSKTLTTNVAMYRQIGGLDTHPIPKTIDDAIQVVKALGKKFLWVDAFCIIQDHPMKQKLIQSMDAVYTHADLCLVASSGINADAGLSGWSDRSSRSDIIPIRSIKPGLRLGVLPFLDGELMQSPHAQRAWTFQEGALSKRCLVFHDSLVYFCCRQSIWREDMHAEFPGRVEYITGANVLARTLDTYPPRRYAQVVAAYTDRHLTFQSDMLNAFAGIEKSLSRSMDFTRFWYGMPASQFDSVILWQRGRRVTLTRRLGFPSYSWAGWQGGLSLPSDVDGEFDHRWLLLRTWISWFILDANHQLVLVWDPIRDGTTRSELSFEYQARQTDDQAILGSEGELGLSNTNDEKNRDVDVSSEGETHSSEHDGDKIVYNLEDDESDKESSACPQYGWPSTGNPYGRLPNHFGQKEGIIAEPPKMTASVAKQLDPGTLCFETLVATFHLDRVVSNANSRSGQPQHAQDAFYYGIYDVDNRLCGAIDGGEAPAGAQQSQGSGHIHHRTVGTLLILSYAAPGHRSMIESWKMKLPSPYEAREPGDVFDGEMWAEDQWHAWDMFNVMLVQARPPDPKRPAIKSLYERLDIGLIHKEALKHALEPVKRTQVLLY